MRLSKITFLLLSWLLVSPLLHAQTAEPASLKVTHFKLDNGLDVYLNEEHSRPEVFGAVVVKAGSKYDPADATGMAHYLEHMCFKGTQDMGTTDYTKEKPYLGRIDSLYNQLRQTTDEKQRDAIQKRINDVSVQASQYAIPNEMDRLLQSIGSKNLNAATSFEQIIYYNSFPPHQIDKWLDLYSHRFINPVFRLFQPELEVVYEEKNRGEDNMGAKMIEVYLQNFFKKHPYGQQTTIGRTEDLKNPNLTRMEQYYHTYFVANNMALVISGDINTQEIIPIIKEKFGQWKSGDVPKYPVYTEEPFKGRELLEKRLTPIKIGIMGFRTVPINHPDQSTLDIIGYMLSNEGETGLLDKLRLEGKIQSAQPFPMALNDLGGFNIFFLPKIVGQSLDDAEGLIKAALDSLKAGHYDPALLTAAKNNLRVDFYKGLEGNMSRAYYMSNCFIRGISWEDYMQYPDKIAAVTDADIKRVMQTYFGDNYLVLQSKMGLPPKDKLKKPDFAPVKPKDSVQSAYAKAFEKIPSSTPEPRFVDFKSDFNKTTLASGNTLWYVPNPINDIFSLDLVYQVGYWNVPHLSDAAAYVEYLGGGGIAAADFKKKMNQLGCSYNIDVTGDKMTIHLSGLEENMQPAVQLLQKLVLSPVADKKKYDLMVSDVQASRKLENGDPTSVGDILDEYLHYGANSSYLSRMSIDELKKTDSAALLKVFQQAVGYPVAMHYSGKKPFSEVTALLQQTDFSTHAVSASNGVTTQNKLMNYQEPTIYVLYRKDARQSHISFYSYAGAFNKSKGPYMSAFNSYFGADMSAIVFQEVREFRSLAYSVYTYMGVNDDNLTLEGSLGCQGDKTSEAISTMEDLYKNMPEKPERLDAVKTGLVNKSYTSRPFFRNLTEQVAQWQKEGFAEDPSQEYLPSYSNLNFNDIVQYYKDNVQKLPVSMAIVGTKDNVPIKELKKYGKVVVVDEDDIVKD